jgi:glutathione peroxidase
MSFHDISFEKLGGGALPLADFKGKPVLVVNTASACGYTPQYAGLEELWHRYGPKGVVVLGVPCNDFGAQEPGDAAAIQNFCTTRYGIDFPMAAKVRVIGKDAHPFYKRVASELGEDAVPKWNFHKFLLGGHGELIESWPSRVDPLSPPVIQAIEAALK